MRYAREVKWDQEGIREERRGGEGGGSGGGEGGRGGEEGGGGGGGDKDRGLVLLWATAVGLPFCIVPFV